MRTVFLGASNIYIEIDGQILNQVESLKYLGFKVKP